MEQNCMEKFVRCMEEKMFACVTTDSQMLVMDSVIVLLCLVYCMRIYVLAPRRNFKKRMLYYGVGILILNSVFQVLLLWMVGKDTLLPGEPMSYVSTAVLGIINALCNFLGVTRIFDNGIQSFLFMNHPYLAIFVTLYVLSVVTTGAIIGRHLIVMKNNDILGLNGFGIGNLGQDGSEIKIHVFMGSCDNSASLCKSIRDGKKILVKFPSQEAISDESVIKQIYKFITKKEVCVIDNDTVEIQLSSTFRDIDFTRNSKLTLSIMNLIKSESAAFYFLSDNETDNIACLNVLLSAVPESEFQCQVFCHARCEELTGYYAEDIRFFNQVHLVDSAHLSIQQLKFDTALHPVNFISKGTDNNGNPLGYATGSFNCMILGFGQTGRDALSFLYEYSAIPQKDNYQRIPFNAKIYDDDIEHTEGIFRKEAPYFNEESVKFEKCHIGSGEFWDRMRDQIKSLNYIVVCLGNDKMDMQMALSLSEFAYRCGRTDCSRLAIVTRVGKPSPLDISVVKTFNKSFGKFIHLFGSKDEIWSLDYVSEEKLNTEAKEYYSKYLIASGGTHGWEDREKELKGALSLEERRDLMRKRSQDYANCTHQYTKQMLCPSSLYSVAEKYIRPKPEDSNEWKKPEAGYNHAGLHIHPKGVLGEDQISILQYLAVCEHLRWNASHIMMGYTYDPVRGTDALLRTHNCITDFGNLNMEYQHYDWVVVKTCLSNINII